MDTLIRNGDHATDSRGIPIKIDGIHEIAQQVIIRLTIPRGQFVLDPLLGSFLNKIPKGNNSQNTSLARQYIEAALIDMPQIQVVDVETDYNYAMDRLNITLALLNNNQSFTINIDV